MPSAPESQTKGGGEMATCKTKKPCGTGKKTGRKSSKK